MQKGGSSKDKGKQSEQELVYMKAEDEVYKRIAPVAFDFALNR